MQNLSYSTNSGGNRAIVFGETVVYMCNEGYLVDFSEKQFQFDAKFSEEGEFTNLLECVLQIAERRLSRDTPGIERSGNRRVHFGPSALFVIVALHHDGITAP